LNQEVAKPSLLVQGETAKLSSMSASPVNHFQFSALKENQLAMAQEDGALSIMDYS
jgi:hypothetical protein